MKKLFFVLLFLAVTLTGCQREQYGGDGPGEVRHTVKLSNVRVDLKGTTEEPDTKSVVSVAVEGFRSAYLFAFIANEGTNKGKAYTWMDNEVLKPVAIYTEEKSFDWALPVGLDVNNQEQHMDIWALVNPPASLVETLNGFLVNPSLTEDDLKALMYVCPDASVMLLMEDTGMPMSGMMNDLYLATSDDPLVFTLKRLFAKYEIQLNIQDYIDNGYSVEMIGINSARCNTEVPYFYTESGTGYCQTDGSKMAYVDFGNEDDIIKASVPDGDGNCLPFVLYMPENCQGDHGPAARWDKVNLLGSEVDMCSRIEIRLATTRVADGWQRYESYFLYPGNNADMASNFDIIRNRSRRIKLNLRMDPSEGFVWNITAADRTTKLAPGESAVIEYETNLLEEQLNFEKGQYIKSVSKLTYSSDNLSNPGRISSFPSRGTVLVTAEESAPEAFLSKVQGGNLDFSVRDDAYLRLTDEASFFNDLEFISKAKYYYQWSCLDLNNTGEAGKKHYVDDYEWCNIQLCPIKDGEICTGTLYNNYFADLTVVPGDGNIFANGKTAIDKAHLYYDSAAGRVFFYMPYETWGDYSDFNEYAIIITVKVGEDGGGNDITVSKKYFLTAKKPVFAIEYYDKNGYHKIYGNNDTEVRMDNYKYSHVYATYSFCDPDTLEKLHQGNLFRWGFCYDFNENRELANFTGGGLYQDNFFRESSIEMVNSYFGDVCYIAHSEREEGALNFGENFLFTSKVDGIVDYMDFVYLRICLNILNNGAILHPVVEHVTVPVPKVNIFKAESGTSEYSEMTPSQMPVGTDYDSIFYLYYGLKQTVYVEYENIDTDVAPTIDIKISDQYGIEGFIGQEATYPLRYNVTKVGSKLYRVDFYTDWIPQLSDFGLIEEGGYYPRECSTNFLQYNVTISTASSSSMMRVGVLLQRLQAEFGLRSHSTPSTYEEQKALPGLMSMYMWNPLGLKFDVKSIVNVDGYLATVRHGISPLNYLLTGGIFFRGLYYFPDDEYNNSAASMHYSKMWEGTIQPNKDGVVCESSDPNQTFIGLCNRVWESHSQKDIIYKDLVLTGYGYVMTHPKPAYSLIQLKVRMNSFRSSVPGLSYIGSFNENSILKYISFNWSVKENFTYRYFPENRWYDSFTTVTEHAGYYDDRSLGHYMELIDGYPTPFYTITDITFKTCMPVNSYVSSGMTDEQREKAYSMEKDCYIALAINNCDSATAHIPGQL